MISVVVPCYNEEETVSKFFAEFSLRTEELQNKTEIEIIFVDDGSHDRTLNEIKKIKKNNKSKNIRVRYLSFSRNFGKESAMYAGLKSALGDYCCVMDVDLQDPPELLSEMFNELSDVNSEYDCIATKRKTRVGEPVIRSWFSKKFYDIINKYSQTEIVNGARDYRLMSRKMVDAVLSLSERNRFSKGLFSWVGFKTKWISYDNIERVAGTTKWNFWKLFKYALDGFASFTAILLKLPVIGVIFGFLGLIASILFAILKVGVNINTALILGGFSLLLLFLSLCFWVVMFYIEKMTNEIKERPIYIIREDG